MEENGRRGGRGREKECGRRRRGEGRGRRDEEERKRGGGGGEKALKTQNQKREPPKNISRKNNFSLSSLFTFLSGDREEFLSVSLHRAVLGFPDFPLWGALPHHPPSPEPTSGGGVGSRTKNNLTRSLEPQRRELRSAMSQAESADDRLRRFEKDIKQLGPEKFRRRKNNGKTGVSKEGGWKGRKGGRGC